MLETPTHPSYRMMAFLGMAMVCTGIAWLSHSWADLAFFLIVYLLGIRLIDRPWGRWLAGTLAILGMLTHDLIFQTHSFRLAVTNWPRFLVFLGLVALTQLVVDLILDLRERNRQLEAKEREILALYTLSQQLAQPLHSEDAAQVAARSLSLQLETPIEIHLTAARDAGGFPLPTSMEPSPRLCMEEKAWERFSPGFKDAALQMLASALDRARAHEAADEARNEMERERMRSSLLSSVSHDFRTPLAAIRGASETLLNEGEQMDSAEKKDLLELIRVESHRLDHLVGNLLQITRLEHGRFQLDRVWQPLEEVVGAALARTEAHEGPLPIQVSLPTDLPPVFIDASLVEQLFLNLLENARHHAAGSPIHLEARFTADAIQVEVSDQGPGIPERDREAIFEKFVRGHSSRKGVGQGLGLAICRAIVLAHGGRIWIETSPEGGASFCFTLPFPENRDLPPPEGDP